MATCKDCIHKDVCYLIEHYGSDLCNNETCNKFLVTPVIHGRWIAQENWTLDDYYYICSICREDFYMIVGTPSDNNYKYCPNCGAKMDGNEVE